MLRVAGFAERFVCVPGKGDGSAQNISYIRYAVFRKFFGVLYREMKKFSRGIRMDIAETSMGIPPIVCSESLAVCSVGPCNDCLHKCIMK